MSAHICIGRSNWCRAAQVVNAASSASVNLSRLVQKWLARMSLNTDLGSALLMVSVKS